MCDMVDMFNHLFGKPLFHPNIPNIHEINNVNLDPNKKIVIFIFGPSGAGKDSVIDDLLKSGTLSHAVTATTRKRRYKFPEGTPAEVQERITSDLSNLSYAEYLDKLDTLHTQGLVIAEPRHSYIWMPQYDPDVYGERANYIEELVNSYDLVEWDIHHGNLYGLPKASVGGASTSTGIPVIRTENNGVKVLLNTLTDYNCVAIAVLPDSFEDLVERMKARIKPGTTENVEQRIQDSINWILEMPNLAHLVLHNSKYPDGKMSGLEKSVRSLSMLIEYLKSNVVVR